MTTTSPSPFLSRSETSHLNSLSLLHLRRDSSIAVLLSNSSTEYAEGAVINTRFGSYPHSTLVNVPYGSQVRASKVNTGLKGRPAQTKKRKRGGAEGDADGAAGAKSADGADDDEVSGADTTLERKDAVTASSGFAHLLPPTPETWTLSLPHRTQVVYTPDYSFVLQRLKVRPGSVLIEAGAGSGSFTHAAARAVFDGQNGHLAGTSTSQTSQTSPTPGQEKGSVRKGHVYSFEYHAQRTAKMAAEIKAHGLSDTVTLTHRDVYSSGFNVDGQVNASAVFLDLPAPWLALPHLTRGANSPLDPGTPVHICCFLPCIEQVQRVMALLRENFVQVEMVEVSARRIEVRRERIGVSEQGLRGANTSPVDIDEALRHLKDVEKRTELFHASSASTDPKVKDAAHESKKRNLESILEYQRGRKGYNEGMVTSRPEPEFKSHTSYLVFAVLPCEWTGEDEERARGEWVIKEKEGKEKKAGGKKGKGEKAGQETQAEVVGADGDVMKIES